MPPKIIPHEEYGQTPAPQPPSTHNAFLGFSTPPAFVLPALQAPIEVQPPTQADGEPGNVGSQVSGGPEVQPSQQQQGTQANPQLMTQGQSTQSNAVQPSQQQQGTQANPQLMTQGQSTQSNAVQPSQHQQGTQ